MMFLWSDKDKNFTSTICWLVLAIASVICGLILYMTYFINPHYGNGYEEYVALSWYLMYTIVALIIATIVYLIAKLFKVGQD